MANKTNKQYIKVIEDSSPEQDVPSVEVRMNDFPFKTRLDFSELIKHWRGKIDSENVTEAVLAKAIVEKIECNKVLELPIDDYKILEQHEKFIRLILGSFFPSIEFNSYLAAAAAPFEREDFFRTPAIQKLIGDPTSKYTIEDKLEIPFSVEVIRACCLILNKYYNQSISIDPQYILTVKPNNCTTLRYFKTETNLNFVKIKKLHPLKEISQQNIDRLLNNIYDLNLWLTFIPPENFEFHGLIVTHFVDITEEESLSRLKHLLLRKHALVDKHDVEKLQEQLRIFFGLRDLRLGLTAIDYPLEFAVSHQYKIRHDFLAASHEQLLTEETKNSIYSKACRYNKSLLIEDLTKLQHKTSIETDLIDLGLKSMIVVPLSHSDEHVIGLLEIGSPRPYELNSFRELKLGEIIGLFRMAMERGRDEIDNKIEAIIREEYTSLHPTVEWRFIEAAYDLLNQRSFSNTPQPVTSIVFRDVYPIYGQADIVGSSTIRNEAIQADMLENLAIIKKLLERAHQKIGFPLIDQYLLKIKQAILQLENGMQSNDESNILELLHTEVHPFLQRIEQEDNSLAKNVKIYLQKLDPELGIIYDKRKDYEDSVASINKTISKYLEKAEQKAQNMLPHYFEKYKTDGIEYEIYVGQSLLKTEKFNYLHLRNLRLWQLLTMCEITCKIEGLKNKLPIPLTTAQLIFVYNSPIAIRFRMDEKRFDVEGAYNVRYEIIKKRIDKALIEGTNKRLTVSGKIAIVYTSEKDHSEYLEYCDYLLHKGYITDEIEELSLAQLQGVQGLKAIRITVNMASKGEAQNDYK